MQNRKDHSNSLKRKQEYLEKIRKQRQSSNSLQIISKSIPITMKISEPPESLLTKWCADETILIDRFDVRSELLQITSEGGELKGTVKDYDVLDEENYRKCNYERYRTIIHNELRNVDEEEYLNRLNDYNENDKIVYHKKKKLKREEKQNEVEFVYENTPILPANHEIDENYLNDDYNFDNYVEETSYKNDEKLAYKKEYRSEDICHDYGIRLRHYLRNIRHEIKQKNEMERKAKERLVEMNEQQDQSFQQKTRRRHRRRIRSKHDVRNVCNSPLNYILDDNSSTKKNDDLDGLSREEIELMNEINRQNDKNRSRTRSSSFSSTSSSASSRSSRRKYRRRNKRYISTSSSNHSGRSESRERMRRRRSRRSPPSHRNYGKTRIEIKHRHRTSSSTSSYSSSSKNCRGRRKKKRIEVKTSDNEKKIISRINFLDQPKKTSITDNKTIEQLFNFKNRIRRQSVSPIKCSRIQKSGHVNLSSSCTSTTIMMCRQDQINNVSSLSSLSSSSSENEKEKIDETPTKNVSTKDDGKLMVKLEKEKLRRQLLKNIEENYQIDKKQEEITEAVKKQEKKNRENEFKINNETKEVEIQECLPPIIQLENGEQLTTFRRSNPMMKHRTRHYRR